jgi:F-box and leucine-rich repeat protein GRR1
MINEKWLEMLPPLTLPPSYSPDNLRVLDLGYCSRITDEAIAGIVSCAPKIQTLVLSGCTKLTDNAIESVCKLSHLDVLALAHVDRITDAAIVKLGRWCPRLRSVDLACALSTSYILKAYHYRLILLVCSKLTDMSVLELAGLPYLRRLNLVQVRKITDNALFFIAEHTATMERLHLSHCANLSLDAVHLLMKELERLQHITLTGVPALYRPGIKRFSEPPPPVCQTKAFIDKEKLTPGLRILPGMPVLFKFSLEIESERSAVSSTRKNTDNVRPRSGI